MTRHFFGAPLRWPWHWGGYPACSRKIIVASRVGRRASAASLTNQRWHDAVHAVAHFRSPRAGPPGCAGYDNSRRTAAPAGRAPPRHRRRPPTRTTSSRRVVKASSSPARRRVSTPNMIGDSIAPTFVDGWRPVTEAVSPSGGAGRFKMADDTSPLPQDRLIIDYSYYSGVNYGPGTACRRPTCDWASTSSSRASRKPFSTARPRSNCAPRCPRSTIIGSHFGNLGMAIKGLVLCRCDLDVCAGMSMNVPTGPSVSYVLTGLPPPAPICYFTSRTHHREPVRSPAPLRRGSLEAFLSVLRPGIHPGGRGRQRGPGRRHHSLRILGPHLRPHLALCRPRGRILAPQGRLFAI